MLGNLNDLRAFLTVVRAGSFTKAGAQMGISQSALSHCIRGLEERLNLKLLHRTTRSISTTDAGEQLYQRLTPLFENIDHEINELSLFRNAVSGTLRINGTEHVFHHVIQDKLTQFLHEYPEVNLEIFAENRFVDIVSERFDAGIRLGDDVAKDMIAIRISERLKMCTVSSPSYLKSRGTPETPYDLTAHNCILHHLPTSGGNMIWEFTDPHQKDRIVRIQPQGQLKTNNGYLQKDYLLSGLGIAWVPQDMFQTEIEAGKLVPLLQQWAKSYDGYYLYYPSRRQNSPLFKALISKLKI
ncbi:MAG: LysR family transcriptional regulator [Neisseria sp.]|uniref:LysR family transcriptional regulator n=1 Tax=Neisseria sp. TaxID=192066 RepID=UPI0026DBC0B6|nr:LysR family transcriptional regulator [Neisseria sp.]MDO4641837.1 LysR family transcriptional regulator [Neisseria sp.]